MHIEELVKFGLSEKEARVYLALLELEVANVQAIAKKSRINRSSTYVVLDSLLKQGLVSVSAGDSKKSYVAAPPDKLLRLAERSEYERAEVRRNLTAILPDLLSLYGGSKQRPRVRIFEGKKGIISAVEEALVMKDKILRAYTSGSHMHKFFREYMPEYMEKRAKAGVRMLGIHPDDAANRVLEQHGLSFDKSVFIPPKKYKFTSDFAIYDNTVAYISHAGEYAIIIESMEIADAMKSAFDLAFDGAKKLE